MASIEPPQVRALRDDSGRSVFLVEDDPRRAHLLSDFFRRQRIRVVWERASQAAYLKLASESPDAIFIDSDLPGCSARDFCLRLRGDGNPTPIMVTTSRYRLLDHIAWLGFGADDYLDNESPLILMLARMNALLRRTQAIPQVAESEARMMLFDGMDLNRDALEVRLNGHCIALAPREFRCLWLLVSRAGSVITREEICAATVMGRGTGLRIRSVDVLISRLKEKIQKVEPGFNAIRSVRSRGYKFIAPARGLAAPRHSAGAISAPARELTRAN